MKKDHVARHPDDGDEKMMPEGKAESLVLAHDEAKREKAPFRNERLGGVIFLVMLVLLGSAFVFFQVQYLSSEPVAERNPFEGKYGEPEAEDVGDKQRVILRGYDDADVEKLQSALDDDWDEMVTTFRIICSCTAKILINEVTITRVKQAEGDGYAYQYALRYGQIRFDGQFEAGHESMQKAFTQMSAAEFAAFRKDVLLYYTKALMVDSGRELAFMPKQLREETSAARAHRKVNKESWVDRKTIVVRLISDEKVTHAINDFGDKSADDFFRFLNL